MPLDQPPRSRLAASTAEATAALRAAAAAEPDPTIRGPDYLAGRFIPPAPRLTILAKVPGLRRLVPRLSERILPGAYFYELARTKLMDEVLLREVERGITQFVLLGAGYDSRAYRFGDRLRAAAVFEVDHPAASRRKRGRLLRIFGAVPDHVSLVEVDFTTDDLAERLAAHGYDTAEPTLFNWSGVVPYLTEEAVDSVLAYVAAHSSPLTSIVFDYISREMIEGEREYVGARELRERAAGTGEPLRFGISAGDVEAFLSDRGLELLSHVPREELAERYLVRSDGRIQGRPYEFGGIVHARVAAP